MSVYNSPSKTCYCETCDRAFHALGIMRHIAMHRDREEDCVVKFTYGDRRYYEFSKGEDRR